jgi:aspartyl aminopeptidase
VKPGGKYYTIRNGSTIVAFTVGHKWRPGNPIAMVGAHTDSPCLRVKPISKSENAGFLQVRVETYGRGLWHSWFDRDLSLAGRVLVRDGAGKYAQKVVRISRPVVRIPFLTVHLNHSPEFTPNLETELLPITGLVEAELSRVNNIQDHEVSTTKEKDTVQVMRPMTQRHHTFIVDLIAEQAGVEVEDVADFEMILYDTQKACIGGLNEEFIHSARLDNLEMTYCSIQALIESAASKDLDDDPSIRMVACFDHEEIGSTSAQGANSDMIPSVIRRLSAVKVVEDFVDPGSAFERTMASSFLISADMAHSVHPNYTGKYEDNHHPEMASSAVLS